MGAKIVILIITKNFELSNEYMPIYKRPHFDVRHMPNQQAKGRVSRDETRPFKHILENAGNSSRKLCQDKARQAPIYFLRFLLAVRLNICL